MTGLADRLAARTLELVDIPSESLHEAEIREHLLGIVPAELRTEYAHDDAFFFVPSGGRTPLVVLAGHYDTVPAQENLPGRIADGAVHGLGASDMKGGVAVAVELVRDLAREPGSYDVGLLLFGREELPAEHNPLPALFGGSSAIHDVALAIVLEPTDGRFSSAASGTSSPTSCSTGRAGTQPGRGSPTTPSTMRCEGLRRSCRSSGARRSWAASRSTRSCPVTRLAAGIADNVDARPRDRDC